MDLKKLGPAELLQLINNTPLGSFMTAARLKKYRDQATNRSVRKGKVNLLRFTAFVLQAKHDETLLRRGGKTFDYEKHKKRTRERQKLQAEIARDVGPLPEVKNPERREECKKSLKLFCETYLKHDFCLGWSDSHLTALERIQVSLLYGGLFALAMPRGEGKTTLCRAGTLWATLYAHRRYPVIIGSDEPNAQDNLAAIKTEIETNDLLLEDFPEVCYPVRQLGGVNNRANAQTLDGVRTRITWTDKEVIFPTVKDSEASGVILKTKGITGGVRGLNYKKADGQTVRPDFVMIDDPQTDQSAKSVTQCRDREKTIGTSILGLAGPTDKIAGVMPCTVIKGGDVADNILNRDKYPEWNGQRTKMLIAFPKNLNLWAEYAEVRKESFSRFGDIRLATQFYQEHRAVLDEGAKVSWEDRKEKGTVSATQNAMEKFLTNEQAFYSEYQNEPVPEEIGTGEQLTEDAIAEKQNGAPLRMVPHNTEKLTAMVDVQGKCLYFVVCAWGDGFDGAPIDYGVFPPQPDNELRLDHLKVTIQDAMREEGKGGGLEAQIFWALKKLTFTIIGRRYKNAAGEEFSVSRCPIDANWSLTTDIVYEFCRVSEFDNIVIPSHGRGITAKRKPMKEYAKKKGDRKGLEWISPKPNAKRSIRHVTYNTNFWKTFVKQRILTQQGDSGSMAFPFREAKEIEGLIEQLLAEYGEEVTANGRTVEEWSLKPNLDNHLWDCLVGAAMAADIEGIALAEAVEAKEALNKTKKKVSYREMQQRKRAEKQRQGR